MKPIYDAWFCQIDITTDCFMSCSYCSRYTKHLRDDQIINMSLDFLEKSLDSLKDWPTAIGIIGGEPLLHPQFEEICDLIQKKFPKEKMGLWTSGGKNWNQEKIDQTFGFIAHNKHDADQKKVCRHQRSTIAIKDVIKDSVYMNELIDDCWVQRTWCPSINVKGAFFCEVAAAQDFLWDGPGGWPIESNWWKRTPLHFKDQRDRYCQNCGMCIPMERDLLQSVEKMSLTVYENMKQNNNKRIQIGKDVEIFEKKFGIDEIEKNKKTWFPGNYRGDKYEDCNSQEGRGSTFFRKKLKLEIITMWHNEEFLAPFFLNHYNYVDKIHIFLDADTNDNTLNIIQQYKNVSIEEMKFPDGMDDNLKKEKFNSFYPRLDCDYVLLVDADEFIFDVQKHLSVYNETVHFTKLWNVYRHYSEKDLDSTIPIKEQRTHGVSDFEGWDVYTKPNIIKSKLKSVVWGGGHHECLINNNYIAWKPISRVFFKDRLVLQGVNLVYTPKIVCNKLLTGAHWAMADLDYAIKRRLDRKQRQSKVNLEKSYSVQHHFTTEEFVRKNIEQHKNDPQVF